MMNDQEVIVKMIMYRCRENGNPVPETLAAYITNTKLNPGDILYIRPFNPLYSYWQIIHGRKVRGGNCQNAR